MYTVPVEPWWQDPSRALHFASAFGHGIEGMRSEETFIELNEIKTHEELMAEGLLVKFDKTMGARLERISGQFSGC